jgi:hypothetical protein
MNYEPRPNTNDFDKEKEKMKDGFRSFTEQIDLAADQLVDRVKELAHEGNVRTIRIKHDNRTIVELPLTAATVGGALTVLIAPQIAILGAIAGALARVTIEVEHHGKPVEPVDTPETKNDLTGTPPGSV